MDHHQFDSLPRSLFPSRRTAVVTLITLAGGLVGVSTIDAKKKHKKRKHRMPRHGKHPDARCKGCEACEVSVDGACLKLADGETCAAGAICAHEGCGWVCGVDAHCPEDAYCRLRTAGIDSLCIQGAGDEGLLCLGTVCNEDADCNLGDACIYLTCDDISARRCGPPVTG